MNANFIQFWNSNRKKLLLFYSLHGITFLDWKLYIEFDERRRIRFILKDVSVYVFKFKLFVSCESAAGHKVYRICLKYLKIYISIDIDFKLLGYLGVELNWGNHAICRDLHTYHSGIVRPFHKIRKFILISKFFKSRKKNNFQTLKQPLCHCPLNFQPWNWPRSIFLIFYMNISICYWWKLAPMFFAFPTIMGTFGSSRG